MNKIEYMAMCLPYGLKVLRGDNITILKVSGIDVDCKSLLFTKSNTTTYGSISHSRPILRPLSDLTKEIEHNGEKFIPITKILEQLCFDTKQMTYKEQCSYVKGFVDPTELIVLQDALLLVKWHFDICGLIEKSEAVDYHALPDFVF